MNTVTAIRADALPMNIEAEQQLIGMALLEPSILSRIAVRGGASLFAEPTHARAFEAMVAKERVGHQVDIVTVGEAMRGEECLSALGGPAYLARCAGASMSPVAAPGYIEILVDLAAKRSLISAMSEAQASIARGDTQAAQIAARLEASLIAASDVDAKRGPVSMQAAVLKALKGIVAAYNGEQTDAVLTGIGALDKIVGGFNPGELIILGGRPSMGKTALALSIALNAARAGDGVAIASLEMTPDAMALRALSEATAQAGHASSYKQLRRGEIAESQFKTVRDVAQGVADLPIMFLERKFADIDALVAGCRQIKRSMGDGLKLLIVDYMQLIEARGENRTQEISRISRALKALAGALNVPVIALSQLSRAVESRDDKRPMLSDLRESGQIEQDADAVLFCYRHEYYVERAKPGDDDLDKLEKWCEVMDVTRNRLDIIVAKQRQGEIGTAKVRCNVALNLIWED